MFHFFTRGKNELYLPGLGVGISTLSIYRGIDLTYLVSTMSHDE